MSGCATDCGILCTMCINDPIDDDDCPDCKKKHTQLLEQAEDFQKMASLLHDDAKRMRSEISELKALLSRALEIVPESDLRREIKERV